MTVKERKISNISARPRWVQVLEQEALGVRYSELGSELGITQDTVDGHVQIVRQLGYPSKMHAIAKIIEQGVLDRGELEKRYGIGRSAFLKGRSKETVDYLKRRENWGKAHEEMAAECGIAANGFTSRLRRLRDELGLASFTQLQVFAYLVGFREEAYLTPQSL
jgi:DNA-binding CsgD family transcriptional regulator